MMDAVRLVSRDRGVIELPISIAKVSGLVNAFTDFPKDEPDIQEVMVAVDTRTLQLVGEFMTHFSNQEQHSCDSKVIPN